MSVPLSDTRLTEYRNLLAAQHLTPGPWIADSHEIHQTHPTDQHLFGQWVGETCDVDSWDTGAANAAFIAAARTAVPELLAEVDRLRAKLTELHYDSACTAVEERDRLRTDLQRIQRWATTTVHGSAAAEVMLLIRELPASPPKES